MNTEILSDIRNKLTVPMVALERLEKGKNVPTEFLELTLKELKMSLLLLEKLNLSDGK